MFFCLVLTLGACRPLSESVKKLDISFLPEETTVMIPVTCDNLDYIAPELLQTRMVTERIFLDNLSKEIYKLKPKEEERPIDIRMKLIIEYENRSDTLCLGEFFDTVLNGNLMEDNPKLLDLIKSKIY